MDLDTGAVVAAELHPADEGDTTTLSKTLAKVRGKPRGDGCGTDVRTRPNAPPTSLSLTGSLEGSERQRPWKTRIAAPKQTGFSRWHGDEAARRAVTNNRARLKSGVAREAFKLRAEIVERCFAHNLDRGRMLPNRRGPRRTFDTCAIAGTSIYRRGLKFARSSTAGRSGPGHGGRISAASRSPAHASARREGPPSRSCIWRGSRRPRQTFSAFALPHSAHLGRESRAETSHLINGLLGRGAREPSAMQPEPDDEHHRGRHEHEIADTAIEWRPDQRLG